jgi:hypothetical protein
MATRMGEKAMVATRLERAGVELSILIALLPCFMLLYPYFMMMYTMQKKSFQALCGNKYSRAVERESERDGEVKDGEEEKFFLWGLPLASSPRLGASLVT